MLVMNLFHAPTLLKPTSGSQISMLDGYNSIPVQYVRAVLMWKLLKPTG